MKNKQEEYFYCALSTTLCTPIEGSNNNPPKKSSRKIRTNSIRRRRIDQRRRKDQRWSRRNDRNVRISNGVTFKDCKLGTTTYIASSPQCDSLTATFDIPKQELNNDNVEMDESQQRRNGFWCCLDMRRHFSRRKPPKDLICRHGINDDLSESTPITSSYDTDSSPMRNNTKGAREKRQTDTSRNNSVNGGDISDISSIRNDPQISIEPLLFLDYLRINEIENHEEINYNISQHIHQAKNKSSNSFYEDEEISFSESLFEESRHGSTCSLERGGDENIPMYSIPIQLETSVLIDREDDMSSQGSMLSFDPDEFQEDSSVEDNDSELPSNLCTILEEDDEDDQGNRYTRCIENTHNDYENRLSL